MSEVAKEYRVGNRVIDVFFNPAVVKTEHADKVLQAATFNTLDKWQRGVGSDSSIAVNQMRIKTVDMFGPRVGFAEMEITVTDEKDQTSKHDVFFRGGAVAILVILTCEGEDYTVLTLQARIPTGREKFPEIPAGMIHNDSFSGVAAKELQEETGIQIKKEDLIDLTYEAFGDEYSGMIPASETCDEQIALYLCLKDVDRPTLIKLMNATTGVREEDETITLRVVPLADLWQIAPDSKSLSALIIYTNLKESGKLLKFKRDKVVLNESMFHE